MKPPPLHEAASPEDAEILTIHRECTGKPNGGFIPVKVLPGACKLTIKNDRTCYAMHCQISAHPASHAVDEFNLYARKYDFWVFPLIEKLICQEMFVPLSDS